MAPPVTVDDTVIYNPRNLYFDRNVVVTLLDGSQIEVWGNFFVNGNPLATIGSLPIATQAEAVAGTDNTKVMTPLRTKESIVANAPGGSGAVGSVNGKTGVVVLNQDEVLDGTTYKQYSQTEKTKLSGIFPGATVNSTDAFLLSRANHTGTQSADTITDGTTNKTFSAAEDTKLAGIAAGATQNSPDATLLARANHTGTQAQSTITNLVTDLAAKMPTAGGTFSADISVPDEAYGVAWNGSLEVPTKNAVYDKIETVGGGGVTDGDKGEITVTSGVWTIDVGTVTNTKLANAGGLTIKGNNSASTAPVADLSASQVKTILALTKSDVGLGNVDNTSDANAPVSTAQQTALDLKANVVRTINTYSGTSLTGVIGDSAAYIRCTGSNPSYTIPPNSSVAFPVGTQIDGIGTATAMTLVAGGGVTINKARTLVTLGADSGWTAIKVATDEWDVHGDFV